MDRSHLNIALACFSGGVVCTGVALVFTPYFWWLGLLAGFAAGYISLEFREWFGAINATLGPTLGRAAGDIRRFLNWFEEPHPLMHASIVLALVINWLIIPFPEAISLALTMPIQVVIFLAISIFINYYFSYFALFILFTAGEQTMGTSDYRPWSYSYVYKTVLVGLATILKYLTLFLVWYFWVYAFRLLSKIPAVISSILIFPAKVVWRTFRIVHSHKRVLCGIDGALGGWIAYNWHSSSLLATAESQIIMTLFGGFLGAAIGLLNWEVVSVRWLKIGLEGREVD